MGSAVGTVVAVSGVAGVAFVGVDVCFALCDLEVGLRGYLVESEFAAGEDFAGIAVAEDVGFIAELDGPFSLATVAASLVGGHG